MVVRIRFVGDPSYNGWMSKKSLEDLRRLPSRLRDLAEEAFSRPDFLAVVLSGVLFSAVLVLMRFCTKPF